jgi:hypothetical protein
LRVKWTRNRPGFFAAGSRNGPAWKAGSDLWMSTGQD